MKRIHLKNHFFSWWEERLPPREKEKIDRHLQECRVCREYFEQMKALLDPPEASHLPTLPIQPWEKTRLFSRLESEQPTSPYGQALEKWKDSLAWVAISLLALLSGFWLAQNLPEKQQAAAEELAFTESLQAVNETSFDEIFEQLVSSLSEENHEN